MSASSMTPVVSVREVPARALALRWIWAGCTASVIVTVVAVVTVALTPHARGIGFLMPLRFAVVTPISMLGSITAAAFHGVFARRFARPGRATTAFVLAQSTLLLLMMATFGRSGLFRAGALAVLASALAMSLLVPRWVDRPKRSRLGMIALVGFGALQVFLLFLALRSERAVPRSSAGLAFDVPRAMFDVDHRFVELPSGARVHYVDEGKGPTLLFLHGNPSWSFQWRDLIRGLRSSYRCVALDYPGFGLSEAPVGFGYTPREESAVVEEFVDRLALRDVTLVMQDWGGPIGLAFAGRHPELVRRVVLGSTWAWPTTTSEPRGKFSAVAGGPLGEFVQTSFNGFAALGIQNGIVHALPDEVLDVYVRAFRSLDRRGIAAFYPGEITAENPWFADLEKGLSRIADKKALIFWALRDVGFPRVDLSHFEAAFPEHETIELPNANHFFFEDELETMLPKIRAFVPTP